MELPDGPAGYFSPLRVCFAYLVLKFPYLVLKFVQQLNNDISVNLQLWTADTYTDQA